MSRVCGRPLRYARGINFSVVTYLSKSQKAFWALVSFPIREGLTEPRCSVRLMEHGFLERRNRVSLYLEQKLVFKADG